MAQFVVDFVELSILQVHFPAWQDIVDLDDDLEVEWQIVTVADVPDELLDVEFHNLLRVEHQQGRKLADFLWMLFSPFYRIGQEVVHQLRGLLFLHLDHFLRKRVEELHVEAIIELGVRDQAGNGE